MHVCRVVAVALLASHCTGTTQLVNPRALLSDADLDLDADGLPILRTFSLNEYPAVTLALRFLTAEEAAHVLERAALVGFDDETNAAKLDACTPALRSVQRRLAALAGRAVDRLERLEVVQIEAGQQEPIHVDSDSCECSVLVPLSALPPEAGGELHFLRLDKEVAPVLGTALMWDNVEELAHRVKRPSGRIYFLRGHFNWQVVSPGYSAEEFPNPVLVDPHDL